MTEVSSARLIRSIPLRYAEGADPALDRPAHVRAASAVAKIGGRLAIVQDDANFVALVDPATGLANAIALPAGEGGLRQFDDLRGNKRFKLDLESCVLLEDGGVPVLLAFGSGSSPLRERIVAVRGIGGARREVRVIGARALYAGLRASRAFAGSEMNVEGAVILTWETLRLFNRGNGASVDDLHPIDASCDLHLPTLIDYLRDPESASPPSPENVVRYELGEIDGHPLTFTDVTLHEGRVWFTATAEASPDAVRDGPVAGSAIGTLEAGVARWARVMGEDGSPFDGKIEAIEMRDARSAWVLVDRDDPLRPSELCEVALEGFGA